MDIEGTYTLQASPTDVWQCLMDQQIILHAIPGLERLTQIDEHTYSFALQIRHAPLRGMYEGRATVLEQQYPASYVLKIEGEGQSNRFSSVCNISLSAHADNTVVNYQSTIQLGRGSALIPAPMVKGTVRVLLQRFFTALSDQLRSEHGDPIYITTLEEMYEIPFMEDQLSEYVPSMQEDSSADPLHWLVRRLGLGQHNLALEELWVRRLRQAGLITIFLLLFWIGTRIPRRLSTTRS